MTLTEPAILRTMNAADFLATVPAICGFTARDSIVVIPFVGKRSHGAMRMDLPQKDDAASRRAIATSIPRLLGQLPDVDGAAVVVYTDETFADRHGTPRLELWREIEKKLRRSGLALKEACCVAPDGWASYLDPHRPPEGLPLAEITESRTALEAAFHSDRIRDISAWNELPAANPATARRVALAVNDLLTLGDRIDAFGIPHPVPLDPIALAELVLEVPASELRPQELAEIVAHCHVPAARDVLLIALAGGRERGERALAYQVEALERRAATGESFDEQALDDLSTRPHHDDDLFMLGRSRFRPERDDLTVATEALRRAAAHAPKARRAGTLCVLAWMLWAGGSMVAASRMHGLARACDPDLRMVETLDWVLSSGPPEWVFRDAYHEEAD
jgi:hypothetical protein